MKFTKMHGIGNDYIYVNCMNGIDFDPVQTSIDLSDRHFGVGAEGVVSSCPFCREALSGNGDTPMPYYDLTEFLADHLKEASES